MSSIRRPRPCSTGTGSQRHCLSGCTGFYGVRSSAFGPLLAAFGLSVWVVSWQSLDWALAFDIGVLAEAVAFVLTFYLFLAFPSGRLQTLGNRLLVGRRPLPVLFFVPWALLTPVIAGGGALSGCRPACPANVLQVGSNPGAVEFLGRWNTYAMLALVIAVLGVYWRRVATASRPQRRALIAVAASSLLFLPIFFIYHFSRLILHADPSTLERMSWALVGIRVIMPLGFLAALFQAQLFAGAARGRLLEQLLPRPSPQQWRDAVAVALDDPPLRIGYWDAAAERYREADGTELTTPDPGSGRSRVEAHRGGQPVAAMVIDDALAEDPELVRAATSATVLAVENGNLEGQLRASQIRVREVGAAERKRIEDNLHDSAQQRLVALRIRLALASERLHGPEQLELQRFGAEVDQVLDDVRSAASGAAPARTRPSRRRRRPRIAGPLRCHARRRRGPRVRPSFRAGRDDRVLLLRRSAAERHQARRRERVGQRAPEPQRRMGAIQRRRQRGGV